MFSGASGRVPLFWRLRSEETMPMDPARCPSRVSSCELSGAWQNAVRVPTSLLEIIDEALPEDVPSLLRRRTDGLLHTAIGSTSGPLRVAHLGLHGGLQQLRRLDPVHRAEGVLRRRGRDG